MNPDSKRPVSLEDLLRLKRAERPPAEFWDRFDRELRAKQLSALVEKRPWWRSLSLAALARYQRPLGATAILAVTVLTVRHYQSAPPPLPARAESSTLTRSVSESRNENLVARAVALEPSVAAVMPADENELAAPAGFDSSSIASVSEGASRSLDSGARAERSENNSSPAARSLATSLVSAKGADFAISPTLLGTTRGFESRAMPARTPVVEPLAQMSSPADIRRSRLLTAVVTAASFAPPTRVNEEASRGLSDDRLYDSVRRFGARGDRLLVKF